ncbi:hypothetical protein ACI77M_18995 [Pseudomonas fildesensis]|uniref:hypothetical protein n=1 Tax=Pseudomonas fildesensis TaxID=1674920 RepID=UPI00387B2AB1
MDPISMASGAIPMVTSLLDKGLDVAKGALDSANKAMDSAGGGAKVGGEEQQAQGPIKF